jgi:hypothetical protein
MCLGTARKSYGDGQNGQQGRVKCYCECKQLSSEQQENAQDKSDDLEDTEPAAFPYSTHIRAINMESP